LYFRLPPSVARLQRSTEWATESQSGPQSGLDLIKPSLIKRSTIRRAFLFRGFCASVLRLISGLRGTSYGSSMPVKCLISPRRGLGINALRVSPLAYFQRRGVDKDFYEAVWSNHVPHIIFGWRDRGLRRAQIGNASMTYQPLQRQTRCAEMLMSRSSLLNPSPLGKVGGALRLHQARLPVAHVPITTR